MPSDDDRDDDDVKLDPWMWWVIAGGFVVSVVVTFVLVRWVGNLLAASAA